MAKGTCSIEGCGKPHYGRGWCSMHYWRWRRHGSAGTADPKWIHRVESVDPDTQTGICSHCGPVALKRRRGRNGTTRWTCMPGEQRWAKPAGESWEQWRRQHPERAAKSRIRSRTPHRLYIKTACEACGFVPLVIAQLDVHHVDGDNTNNDPSNLQTLCANCHRAAHYA